MKSVSEIFNIPIENEELFTQALTHPSFTKENNLSYKSILNAVYPHPTFSEAAFEAILALDNESLSLPKIKE